MKTIWKFPMVLTGVQTIEMPKDAEILTVQDQFNEPMMWAIVDLNQKLKIKRLFEIHTTGGPVHDQPKSQTRKYIGTFQTDGGNYVFHVFEVIKIA